MDEVTHTPGPWVNDGGLVYGRSTEFEGAPSFDIYDAKAWPGHADEALANAKLISAAPDMLEVLRCIDNYPEINLRNYDETDVIALVQWANDFVVAADAAIRKAGNDD